MLLYNLLAHPCSVCVSGWAEEVMKVVSLSKNLLYFILQW